jgi:hypothetical protein
VQLLRRPPVRRVLGAVAVVAVLAAAGVLLVAAGLFP